MALWKLQCFFTRVMGPYRFFDGSGPKFFCRVNGLYGPIETPVFLTKVMGPYRFFDGSGPKCFCRINGLYGPVETPAFLCKRYGSVPLF